jgi:formylglycine-generating enzyme
MCGNGSSAKKHKQIADMQNVLRRLAHLVSRQHPGRRRHSMSRDILEDNDLWSSAKASEQDARVRELQADLPGNFAFARWERFLDGPRLALFRHVGARIPLVLLPGGNLDMGLSPREVRLLEKRCGELPVPFRASIPQVQVKIRPFLVARTPVLSDWSDVQDELEPSLERPEFGDADDRSVTYLSLPETMKLTKRLEMDVATEAQWEYLCRAGQETLFPFGDKLLAEDRLEAGPLRCVFNTKEDLAEASNRYGVAGLAAGERCSSVFTTTLERAQAQVNKADWKAKEHVVRGGAAALWPWQHPEEWFLLVSAVRWSSNNLTDGVAGVRLVKNIDIA